MIREEQETLADSKLHLDRQQKRHAAQVQMLVEIRGSIWNIYTEQG